MVERFVEGVELALSVIDLGDGPRGPAGGRDRARVRRLRLHRRATRRVSPSTTRRPGSSEDVAARAAALAVRVHEVLGLADLSRTDAIVAADGEVHFLEVNVSPGLTETSMFPMAVEAAGYELGEVLARLLARRAAARYRTR